MTFLADRELRPVTLAEANGLHADGLILGKGASALEIVLTSSLAKPSVYALRAAWKARVGGRATPVLLVTLYDGKAAVVGPSGDHPPAYTDLEPSKLERICAAALDEPDRHTALRFLNSVLGELQSATCGLRNEGLFASHELEIGVPAHLEWNDAATSSHLRDLSRRLGLSPTVGSDRRALPSMAEQAVKPQQVEIPSKPEFVDNRELDLATALCGHMDWLEKTYVQPLELCVATGYFNPEGFSLLAERLEKLKNVRLLLGAEPVPPPARPVRMPGEPSGARFEQKLVNKALTLQQQGLERDRNLLEFSQATDRAVRRLLDFLASGRIEVRRYEQAFLHGKAYLFATDHEGVVAGSSNFTAAGLTRNLELNLGRYDPTPVAKVANWFETLWAEASPYDLAKVYEARYEAYAPYIIFLRVLWERYKNEMELEERVEGARIRLTTFQTDGVSRAERILDKYNGVLIADGVGLGKTFIGGAMLRHVVEDNRQRALLIAPAALRDGTWDRFKHIHKLYMEVISYEELANEAQLGMGTGHYLKQAPNYELVVIDEAQALRNPGTQRGKGLRALLQGKPPKKLVLMSATPVNNSLWDLYYLLTYFARQDATFADLGITSLKDRFADAMRMEPDDLTPDILFDILDATTVRRTRHFVQRYYPNDRVIGPDGKETAIRFPDPHVKAVEYSFDPVLPGFFAEFEEALAPPFGLPKLTLARYEPSKYVKGGGGPSLQEAALVGLIRSGLLKRFESSAYAFSETCRRMADACDVFLKGLDEGVVLTAEGIEEWEQTDNDEILDRLVAAGSAANAALYDVPRLRADVERDRDLLRGFAERGSQVTRENDPKLEELKTELLKVLEQAEAEAIDLRDERDKRKIIIFSFFADTADWIYKYLEELFASDLRFAKYRGRLACVRGDESYAGVSREEAVFGFVPISSEAPAGRQQDRFDVLVTTDVLAEGMNLQQCRNIINYDLPWNPMRLVQRHGRIDRIGSPHKDVYLRCFFTDKRLDALLELEARIRRKVAQAAATVGVESEVIPGARRGEVVFADERAEIEKLRKQDATLFVQGGEDPNAHTGEEYRQELRKGLEKYGELIEKLPWGSGSAFRGQKAGHFYCAYVGERLFMRFVAVAELQPIRDTLGCLRLITCTEGTERADVDLDAAYAAWEIARADIYNEWAFATDPANLQPKVRPALKAAADQLRKYPPPNVTQDELVRLIKSVEAPWGIRIEKQIRDAHESLSGTEASTAIAQAIKRLGLEPFKAPEPLPPIVPDEVKLVCWMQVTE
jgi:hypothetical protein